MLKEQANSLLELAFTVQFHAIKIIQTTETEIKGIIHFQKSEKIVNLW